MGISPWILRISNLFQQERSATQPELTWVVVLKEILQRSLGDLVAVPEGEDSDRIFAQLDELARSGRQEVFVELVKAEQQRTESNEPTILMSAVMAKNVEVVKALLDAGADVHAKHKHCSDWAKGK